MLKVATLLSFILVSLPSGEAMYRGIEKGKRLSRKDAFSAEINPSAQFSTPLSTNPLLRRQARYLKYIDENRIPPSNYVYSSSMLPPLDSSSEESEDSSQEEEDEEGEGEKRDFLVEIIPPSTGPIRHKPTDFRPRSILKGSFQHLQENPEYYNTLPQVLHEKDRLRRAERRKRREKRQKRRCNEPVRRVEKGKGPVTQEKWGGIEEE